MKKSILLLSSIIMIGILAASFSYSNSESVSKEKVVHKTSDNNNISPKEVLIDPIKLEKIWLDKPISLSEYTEEEIAIQLDINQQLSKQHVLTFNHLPDNQLYNDNNYSLLISERNIDNEPITPYTWKVIHVKMDLIDGSVLNAQLRRPNWWVKENKADKVGSKFHISIHEMAIDGEAEVIKIGANQIDTRIKAFEDKGNYTYRPITGWFERVSNDTWNYEFSNGETIGSTSNHPYFSEDKQAYVPIGEVEIGERIKVKGEKTTKLVSKTQRNKGEEKVYNLEVYRDHNFHVGKEGLLVHNSCLIGKIIQETAYWFRYKNFKNKILKIDKQNSTGIATAITAAENLQDIPANIGKRTQAKVARAVQQKKGPDGIEGYDVKVYRDNGNPAGDMDILTNREFIEVKKSISDVKVNQIKKYSDFENDDFMNLNAKKVILYIDDISGNPNHPTLNAVRALSMTHGIEVKVIIGSLDDLKNALE